MALGDDLGDDLAVDLLIGAEMREGGIAAQHLAIMHAHDAAAERVVDAIFNLVKSVQQRKFPRALQSPAVLSIAGTSGQRGVFAQLRFIRWRGRSETGGCRLPSMPLEILYLALVLLGRGARLEGAEIAPLAGLRIYLARIEPVLAGSQFADHG
jgi:hypothetical protein